MSETVRLVALVIAAVLASTWLARRGRYGFVSGAEYLLAGVALGPAGFGALDAAVAQSARPAIAVVAAWVGLLFGLRMRLSRVRRLGARGGAALIIEAGGTALLVWLLLPPLYRLAGGDPQELRGPLLLALAVVAAASTKSTLHWARQQHRGRAALSQLELLVRHDDLLCLVGLLALCARYPADGAPLPFVRSPWLAAGTVLALGVLLGGVLALLGGRRPPKPTLWALLLGVTLLGAGLSTRLALPAMVVCLIIGLIGAAVITDRALILEISEQTERPAVILLMVLVGVSVPLGWGVAVLALCTAAVRLLGKLGSGPVLSLFLPGGPLLGAGLVGFGGVALAAAAQVELLYGTAGALALGAAFAQGVVGDLAAPLLVRAMVARQPADPSGPAKP